MRYSETLPKSPGSPARARRVLARLEGELDESALASARLLVSELVANAVEHVSGDGDIVVEVALEDAVLRVEVRDPGGGFSQGRRPGMGLHLVEALADRWAAEAGEGHRVWFEIAVP
jgi:anti-sigma regulatory factor (Ser/Thr protein kinase)